MSVPKGGTTHPQENHQPEELCQEEPRPSLKIPGKGRSLGQAPHSPYFQWKEKWSLAGAGLGALAAGPGDFSSLSLACGWDPG